MKRRPSAPVLLVVLLASSLGVPPAHAADEEGQVDATTEDLIQQGIAARRAGKDEAALAVFLEAETRVPNSVRILLHIATAAQGTGKWLMAHAYLQKAALYRNHPYYQKYRAAIHQVEDTVALHVGQFRAQGTPAGAEVFLNGEVLGKLPMEGSVAVEIGAYQLEVTKPGYFPLRRPISVTGGGGLSTESVELKSMDHPLDPLTVDRVSNGPNTSDIRADASAEREGPSRRSAFVTWALVGGSAVLLGTSGIFFAIRERDASRWNNDNVCLDRNQPQLTRESICGNLRQDVTTSERIGIVAGALGVGLGVAAVSYWLYPSKRTAAPADQAKREASCSTNFTGITCGATF